jgi:hypothetical protein
MRSVKKFNHKTEGEEGFFLFPSVPFSPLWLLSYFQIVRIWVGMAAGAERSVTERIRSRELICNGT